MALAHSQYEDEDILNQFAPAGNPELGLRWLMNKYQEPLYVHVFGMMGNQADASDVLQNSFIKVFRYIGKFERQAKLYTWLYRIATNEALTALKKRQRTATVSLEHRADDADQTEVQPIAHESVDGDRAQALLSAAIDGLPPKQKQVFWMRYYEEKSYQEMSELLETSIGALKASYHHAVKKVEDYIKSQG